MTINIKGHQAVSPVAIKRGSPQGSVLGCLLYCVTTQSLTKGLRGEDAGAGGADKPEVFMYVDDTILVDGVRVEVATLHLSAGTTRAHFDNLALEGDLKLLGERAEDMNMKINTKKTQLLLINPQNSMLSSASISTWGGESVSSIDSHKLVGFTFGNKPGAAAHLVYIGDRFRRRIWMIFHLRKAGFRGRTLYRLYCVYLRSIVEYCSVAYHGMLTTEQELELERLHRLAIKVCFGFGLPTDQTMAEHGIESLKDRRARRRNAFLRKALRNPRFAAWFPPRDGIRRPLRRRREVQEIRATTNRRSNSPLAFLRRRANKHGLWVGRGDEDDENHQ